MGSMGRPEVWGCSGEWNCVQPPQERQGKVPREGLTQGECHVPALWPGKGWCLDTRIAHIREEIIPSQKMK